MKPSTRHAGERGFSLIELLVAMFVTLIVSGAIFGLIASGQTAFRREPELADRQQNIRIAMDLIQRDVLLAGQGVPWFGQVFTRDDFAGANNPCPAGTGLNGCGLTPGTLGATAAAARGPAGDVEQPDILETVATEEQCPFYTVCDPPAILDTATQLTVMEPLDTSTLACMQGQTLLLATNNYNFAIVATTGAGGGTCGGGNRSFLTPAGTAVGSWASITGTGGFPADLVGNPVGGNWLAQARIARYEIALDPTDGAPSLWRSTTSIYNSDGTNADRAGAGVGTWQIVARGIEDLQVEYMDGGGVWQNRPTAVGGGVVCGITNPTPATCTAVPTERDKLTQQVRVTLSARSMAPNMPGEMQDGNQTPGTEALRGQLQAVIAPRAAKVGLTVP